MHPAKVQVTTRLRDGLTAAVLAACTFAVFAPALDYGFVNFDDGHYVTQTEQVTKGLSLSGAGWAFTTYHTANWHPLTWLSLQLDATLWPKPADKPLQAFGFHLTNVLLHSASAALLFLALRLLTGAYWRSAAVALLFAVHPLRVESVAWISERKDDLSVFFGLLALWAYADYARRPSVWRYLAVAAAFAASLLSKPMLVTLPFLFLVLDWWPLQRWPARRGWLLLEKLPLLALVLASSWFTVAAQREGGAVKTLEAYPVAVRLENAVVSYAAYLVKTVWPARLSPYYPHPRATLPISNVAAACLLLVALTAGAAALWRKAPYLLAGWLWFLGTLVPAIGLVQVGGQAMADRYSYFPQIGILIAACWGVAALAGKQGRVALAGAAVAAVVLAGFTLTLLPIWKDSLSLWEHARRTSGDCSYTLISLGLALDEKATEMKRPPPLEEEERCYRRAIEVDDAAFNAHYNLGLVLLRQGRLKESVDELRRTCELVPDFPMPHSDLGGALLYLDNLDEAAAECERAIGLMPGLAEAHRNLGLVELKRKNIPRAAAEFREAVDLRPTSSDSRAGLGVALAEQGELDEAVKQLIMAVKLDPRSVQAYFNLGTTLEKRQEWDRAADCFQNAIQLNQGMAMAWYKLGMIRTRQEKWRDAASALARARLLDPGSSTFGPALETALKRLGESGQGDLERRIRDQLNQQLRSRGAS
jgi:tetratricopeptide (TPR) repeat protein